MNPLHEAPALLAEIREAAKEVVWTPDLNPPPHGNAVAFEGVTADWRLVVVAFDDDDGSRRYDGSAVKRTGVVVRIPPELAAEVFAAVTR